MNLIRFLGKGKAAFRVMRSQVQPSFSQAGEDLIINYLANALGLVQPSYLDIGTNHPVIGNNTYYFYNRGSAGVCVEPDPAFSTLIRKHRKRDVLLSAGVASVAASSATLYIFPDPYSGWNTFSEEEAMSRQKESGVQIAGETNIPLLPVNEILQQKFKHHPNILSLDVEGMDLEILKSIDFQKYPIEILCVETITFSTRNQESKLTDTIEYVESQGYFNYADTHINTIFCRTEAYKRG